MPKRNHVARMCKNLGVGVAVGNTGSVATAAKARSMTAVERVLAIRAAKIAELKREFFFEDKAEASILIMPKVTEVKTPTSILPRNIFKISSRRIKREREPEKEVVLRGHSNFSLKPMRPRTPLKVLNVYARSRGGREEPGRRFERNKEDRKGGRMSIRRTRVEYDMYGDGILIPA